MGKSSMNGQFSMAMLNNQRVSGEYPPKLINHASSLAIRWGLPMDSARLFIFRVGTVVKLAIPGLVPGEVPRYPQ